ncbi:hypothetical protein B0A55_07206 [Friedmanniomyces simplex]|uniref:Calcineurin-like phosphoesterase domain-containing protein n=1 Tax=Friedmanniomyces simplex TaxID=329884 RepID=A0A4U0XIF1_9PEZI|nr:hypothetical protein B0A55_07206 [Friedmanniomyces simplex]
MSAVELLSALLFAVHAFLGLDPALIFAPKEALPPPAVMSSDGTLTVITDLNIQFGSAPIDNYADSHKWHRIEKDLYLHTTYQQAWLEVEQKQVADLTLGDLVITAVRVDEQSPASRANEQWESRPGNIWLLKKDYNGDAGAIVTSIDVLFGTDAVDPRPGWTLVYSPLALNAPPEAPVAKITVRHGRPAARPDRPQTPLRARVDGKFKIVQISDTHMVTGPGVCKDASDANGQPLPESEADPLSVKFIRHVLDVEGPDLVVLTGDQLHHDILDSQSTLFKVVAPLVERSIPFAPVFGNHDDEGSYALSRNAQMQILDSLPFNLARAGPANTDGVSNYHIQILGSAPSPVPMATLYLIDSHGQIPSEVHNPDYKPIQPSQIKWLIDTSRALRKAREKYKSSKHLSLAFQHIPLPEYADSNLITVGGHRREPTEGPSVNTHFYDTLLEEGVVAVGCGHDHVNDFCGLLPRKQEDMPDGEASQLGPWLCHGGGTGFGGYMSYGPHRYHRRSRIWELDAITGGITTWKRVEYASERVDELVLVAGGAVVAPP